MDKMDALIKEFNDELDFYREGCGTASELKLKTELLLVKAFMAGRDYEGSIREESK